MKFNVYQGSIVEPKEKVDAIVTLVNPGPIWAGNVDRAIKELSYHFHNELAERIGNIKTCCLVESNSTLLGFRNVLFVIDNLSKPLEDLVYTALLKANLHGLSHIALPVFRTGTMLGCVEKTKEEAVLAMIKGFHQFKAKYPKSHLTVDIVIYNDPEAEALFNENL